MRKTKRGFKIFAFTLAVLFAAVNIAWLCFYMNQKSYLNTLMQTHEIEKTEAPRCYGCDSADEAYSFYFWLPKYLSFRAHFQAVGFCHVSKDENGRLVSDKKYHGSLSVNKLPWERNWFSIEIDQTADDEGYYLESSDCESIDYYPGFVEKKVWYGISDLNENGVRDFFADASDEVTKVYDRAAGFFGEKYLK